MNFENMTDDEVEASLQNEVNQERKTLHVILEHIREVDSRRLHLKRAYSSLREYLIGKYGYSGTAADRRVEAAQLMKDVPVIAEKVRAGDLNLSQIGEVHAAIKQKERLSKCKITKEEKVSLVESVVGLTVREAQQELSRTLDIPIKRYEKVRVQQDGSVILEMILSKEDFDVLNLYKEKLAQQLIQQNKEINLANTIGLLLSKQNTDSPQVDSNEYLNANKSNLKKSVLTHSSTDAGTKRINKTLTPKTRSIVLQKSDCCQYKDTKTGRVCGSKFIAQVDHKHSLKMGGSHAFKNLQTLCSRHNRFKYEQEKLLEMNFFG